MNILKKWFGKTEQIEKPYTCHLEFQGENGRVNKLTFHNVQRTELWMRVLKDTPDQEPVASIHCIYFANGDVQYFRDNHMQRLLHFKKDAVNVPI